MRRVPCIRSIFFKEWREMLRDHRVVFGVFIGPFLFTIGMFAVVGLMISKVGRAAREAVVPLAVVRPDLGSALIGPFEISNRFRVTEVSTLADGEALLRSGHAKLVMAFTQDAAAALAVETPVPVQVVYDASEPQSELALQVVQGVIQETNRRLARQRLQARRLSPTLLEPFQLQQQAFEGRSESVLSRMVPYFLMLWSLIGGVTIAADLVAGEKERGTLETLLTSPISRTDVITGKFLALLSQSWVGLGTMLLGLYVGWSLVPPEAREAAAAGVSLSPLALGLMVLAMLPYTVFAMALLFLLATFARNQREAQGYLGMVMFMLMIPIVIGQFAVFLDLSRQWWIGLIPILNVVQVLHDALTQRLSSTLFGLTLLTMSLLATGTLLAAGRLFNREAVLFRV
jgi:sodium transport system permease protein